MSHGLITITPFTCARGVAVVVLELAQAEVSGVQINLSAHSKKMSI